MMIGQLKNLIAAGAWTSRPSVKTGLTAAANGTATAALQLTADINVVSTTTSTNNSALLPAVQGAGSMVAVLNTDSTETLNVFAAASGKVNNVTTTFAVAAGKGAIFISMANNEWIAVVTP
jgi:hypothetical protein